MRGHLLIAPSVFFALTLSTISALGTLIPSTAHAQESASEAEVERARQLFVEGLDFSDQGNWDEALLRFRAVAEVRRAPPVLLNLATALVEVGEFPEANAVVAELIAGDAPSNMRAGAEDLRDQMFNRGGSLRVALDATLEGLEIRVDGYAIAEELLSAPIPVSAGEHLVEAMTGEGQVRSRRELTIAQNETLEVQLQLAPSPQDAARGAEPGTDGGFSLPPIMKDWRLWAAVGAGVVLIVVVVAIAASSGGSSSEPYQGNFSPGTLVLP